MVSVSRGTSAILKRIADGLGVATTKGIENDNGCMTVGLDINLSQKNSEYDFRMKMEKV